MDNIANFQSVEHLINSLHVLEASLKAKSVSEFAEKGLLKLSEIMESPWIILAVRETKLFPPRLFHQGFHDHIGQALSRETENLGDILFRSGNKETVSIPLNGEQGFGMLLYPLQVNGNNLGAIGVASDHRNVNLPPEMKERIVNLVFHTIEKLVESEDISHQMVHLRTYQTVSSLLAQTMDLHELLDMSLYACMDVVAAEAASVLLLTEDKKNFNFYQVEGDAKPQLSDRFFPADSGIAGFVLSSRKSEIVNSVQDDSRFYGQIDTETGFKTRNMMVFPLLAGDEPIGVLEIVNKVGGEKFTEKEHLLICSIAEEIAFAIRNAKVFNYVVGTYCKQRQGQMSCKGCKRPLGSWTPCVKYQESEFKKLSAVEPVIYHNLNVQKAVAGSNEDRRVFPRKDVTLPAFICEASGKNGEFEAGVILDISLGGIRFSLSKGTEIKQPVKEFTVIFVLAEERRPIRVKCRAMWVVEASEDSQIGAVFVDPDDNVRKILQKYIL